MIGLKPDEINPSVYYDLSDAIYRRKICFLKLTYKSRGHSHEGIQLAYIRHAHLYLSLTNTLYVDILKRSLFSMNN